MRKEKIEKIRQAYDKWIGDKPKPEEVKFMGERSIKQFGCFK